MGKHWQHSDGVKGNTTTKQRESNRPEVWLPLCGETITDRTGEGSKTMHPNIEKSAFRHGEYVGYCNGAQKIRKGGQGWETYGLGSQTGVRTYATAQTLFKLGEKLAYIASNTPWNGHKTGTV